MTKDEDFVEYCYSTILGRSSDSKGKAYYLSLLQKGYLRHEIMQAFLESDEYRGRQKVITNPFITFAPPGHFYSPLPDINAIVQRANRPILGININEGRQIQLLKAFSNFYPRLPFPDGCKGRTRYWFNGNEWYSYGDAIILFCMINYLRPKQFIEVGSGYSSIVTLDTCEMLGGQTEITLIEPYPNLLLNLLSERDDPSKLLLSKAVQDVDLSIFEKLRENDILFIDSSHNIKFNSDVLFIITEVLPRLKPGVNIHFHDIFWPFEYPLEWLRKGLAWNEAYFLRAFLTNNENYEIQYFNDYMGTKHRDLLGKLMPLCLKNWGCGIWIRKIK